MSPIHLFNCDGPTTKSETNLFLWNMFKTTPDSFGCIVYDVGQWTGQWAKHCNEMSMKLSKYEFKLNMGP